MFKVGDIVRPKTGMIGDRYLFKIHKILHSLDNNDVKYRLQRIEQELDPIYGKIEEQLNTIYNVESVRWSNEELRYCYSTKLKKVKIKIDKINKEEEEMDILEIYKERKIKTLEKEFSEAKKAAIEEDEIQKIIIEMTNQVNTILENEDSDTRYESHPNLYTSKTEAKLNELNDKYHEQIEELRSTLDEIRALFELTDDYNERIKILKNYDILDKKGKLNI